MTHRDLLLFMLNTFAPRARTNLDEVLTLFYRMTWDPADPTSPDEEMTDAWCTCFSFYADEIRAFAQTIHHFKGTAFNAKDPAELVSMLRERDGVYYGYLWSNARD